MIQEKVHLAQHIVSTSICRSSLLSERKKQHIEILWPRASKFQLQAAYGHLQLICLTTFTGPMDSSPYEIMQSDLVSTTVLEDSSPCKNTPYKSITCFLFKADIWKGLKDLTPIFLPHLTPPHGRGNGQDNISGKSMCLTKQSQSKAGHRLTTEIP